MTLALLSAILLSTTPVTIDTDGLEPAASVCAGACPRESGMDIPGRAVLPPSDYDYRLVVSENSLCPSRSAVVLVTRNGQVEYAASATEVAAQSPRFRANSNDIFEVVITTVETGREIFCFWEGRTVIDVLDAPRIELPPPFIPYIPEDLAPVVVPVDRTP